MPDKHALLSPSSAHRWLRCNGSLLVESEFDNSHSPDADLGTTAHAFAELCLKKQIRNPQNGFLDTFPAGEEYPAIDEEMLEFVPVYVSAVLDHAAKGSLYIEQRVNFSRYVGVEDSFGTVDALILTGNEIQVHDLKYGKGVRVDAENNEQLQLYALGAYDVFRYITDITTIRLFIHQVRLNTVSEWGLSLEELLKFGEYAKQQACNVIRIFNGGEITEQSFAPSDKACKFCKAKATCRPLAQHVADTVAGEFINLDAPVDLSSAKQRVVYCDNTHIAHLLPQLDIIESFCKAVRMRATDELQKGHDIPGYKLVTGKRGARSWSDEHEAERELRRLKLRVSDIFSIKLVTPTQIEKLLKAFPTKWDSLQPLIIQKEGAPSVVPLSDRRPALSVSPMEFDDLT